MIPVSINPGKQWAIRGIKPLTASGAAARVDQQDQPIGTETTTGDAVGLVENVAEYTDTNGNVGHVFDLVIKRGTPGTASVVKLTMDADNDAGETRELSEEFNVTSVAEEAASLSLPTGTEEDAA